jgi:hypothetical protein
MNLGPLVSKMDRSSVNVTASGTLSAIFDIHLATLYAATETSFMPN